VAQVAATPPRGAPIVWRLATVHRVIPETDRAASLELDVDGWPGHLAGHHLDIRLTAPDGYQAQRSYSIASPPEAPRLTLTVERMDDGEVSPYLVDEARAGDEFEVRGPIGGHFTWRVQQGGPLLLIGGGSGLVPLMAMVRHRAAQRSVVDTRLLVSARGPEDVLYRAELMGLADAEGLRIDYTLTRRAPSNWSGWTRRVDAEMLAAVGAGGAEVAQSPRVYVCGPTAFVERVADLLVAAGHDPSRIHAERFGPSGT
jgi:ferredoxin-NADP reductase